MKKVYDEYIEYAGGYGHPVSLETANLLFEICEKTRPKKILDMGSGFSSYVFHKYKNEINKGVEIISVDTSDYWMARTEKFLVGHGIGTPVLVHIKDLVIEKETFDLVFHDISSAQERNDLMPKSIEALMFGGTIVFDDMQHDPHRISALSYSNFYGVVLTNMMPETLDKIGRWAMVGVKK